ncbi:hypothetical protein ACFV9P_27990 [Streptomyces sp. NPDC059892]|uniref:hypothetical protein n=1 Tax=Streptomyces sp. NPDC059892 TaxID=3346989 RepID=UPI003657321C
MEAAPWADRVRDEDELLTRLNRLASESATRRAQALREGVEETGSIAEVARVLGRSWNAVYNALKKQDNKKAPSKPGATTTE